jgi:polar amino acid transport system substrate-binding protein
MRKTFLSFAGGLFLAAAALLLLSSQAAEPRAIIAVTEAWPPFRINEEKTRWGFSGIDVDILEAMEQELGVRVKLERHPFARCLEMLKSGQADLFTGLARSDERAAYVTYVPSPYFTVGPVFYTKKGKGALIKEYGDLYGRSVGYSLNSVYFEPFNSDAKLEKIGISTELQLIQMLVLGRIDVTIGTNPNLAYDILANGYADKLEQTAYVPEQKTPIYFGISSKSPVVALSDRMDAFIKKLISSGRMDKIAAKYR